MKKQFRKLGLALIVLAFTGTAQAGFLAEPYTGIGFGVGDTSGEQAVAGGRLGMGFLPMITFGVQANYFLDAENYTAGVFVMADLPIVRAWAGYNFLGDDLGVIEHDGGLFAGVGFGFLPFVSINVEYHKTDFKAGTLTAEQEVAMLTVSLPLP